MPRNKVRFQKEMSFVEFVQSCSTEEGAMPRRADRHVLARRLRLPRARRHGPQLHRDPAHLPVLGLLQADLDARQHDLPQIVDAADQVVLRYAPHHERQERISNLENSRQIDVKWDTT